MSATAIQTFFIITKARQGGRVYLKMNGKWTKNRFHVELYIFHSRTAADDRAFDENATVVTF
jgi:hypothetical protein